MINESLNESTISLEARLATFMRSSGVKVSPMFLRSKGFKVISLGICSLTYDVNFRITGSFLIIIVTALP